MVKKSRWILVLLGVLLVAGCSAKSAPVIEEDPDLASTAVPRVVASISPLAWIVSEIAADQVKLIPLMPEGADPATWSPDAEALETLAAADLIILNSTNLERWAQRVSLPIVKTLEVARTCKDQWLRYPEVVTHSHGPEGERSYEGVDGHTWLDPELLRLAASAIKERLVGLVPEQRTLFEQRFQVVDGVLAALTQRLIAITAGVDVPFLESGPYWGYPCAMAGLSLRRVDLDPEGNLDASTAELLALVTREAASGILLWATEPSADLREGLLAQARIESVVWSPAYSLGAEYPLYPEIQQKALTRLEEALSRRSRRP
ncbi:MAG: zinc ABC transporter substrate-binding protein [Planctomycetes bacterium]|nr:zinc ABC transporter substrate-binding protein [Planctomycetota bacterium]